VRFTLTYTKYAWSGSSGGGLSILEGRGYEIFLLIPLIKVFQNLSYETLILSLL
jgi:hypothetical protein